MLRKVFGSSENIEQAAVIVFVATLASKVFSYIEKTIIAMYFGTTTELDMFYLAYSVSIGITGIVFSGLSIVGVTLYSKMIASKDRDKANRYISSLLFIVTLLAFLMIGVLVAGAPMISRIMAPQYTGAENVLLCRYIRILSFVALFYAICTVLTAVLNANRKFLPGALCISIQNIVLIICIIVLSETIDIEAVVFGCVLGYILQGIFLYLCTREFITLTKFSLKEELNYKKLLMLLLPVSLGDVSGGINLLLDKFIAGGLGEGYISALFYSETLESAISSLFIQAGISVLLPFFSILAINKQYAEMSSEICKASKNTIVVLLPVTIISIFMAPNIVSIIFKRGMFDSNSVAQTSMALMGYSFGIVFKALFLIAKRPFYAIGDTITPMYLAIASVSVNMLFTILLSNIWGIFGVTFSTSIAFGCGTGISIYLLRMKKLLVEVNWRKEFLFLGKLLIAGGVSGSTLYLLREITSLDAVNEFVMGIIICLSVYYICLRILQIEEFDLFVHAVISKHNCE